MHKTDDRIKCLPPLLANIARVTDYDTAMKIGYAWGGTKRSIATRFIERSALTRIVGLESARKIVAHFQGLSCRLDIPVVRDVEKIPLKEQILAAHGGTRQIATSLQCSERYVRMVRNQGTT